MKSLKGKQFVAEASLQENKLFFKLISMKNVNLTSLSYIYDIKQA